MRDVVGPLRFIFTHGRFRELLGCMFLLGLVYSFVLPFFSMFGTREVGMSSWTFAVFMIATSLAAVVASTVLARWSDTRYSRRSILILGCLGGALGYGVFAYVRDVPTLFFVGCFVLSVSSVTFSQLFAYAREMIMRSELRPSEAPLYLNVFRLTYALSWTAGPAIAAWTMMHHGFRGTFLAAAGLFLALLLLILHVVPANAPTAAAQAAARVPLRQTLRRPDILVHFCGFVLLFAAGTMNMLNLPLLVLHSLGGGERDIGIIFSIAPAFEIPLMFYFGLLASKGHQGSLIRAAAVIALVYYAGLASVQAPWQIYPLQVLSAALVSITSGVAISFFQDYLPEQPGTATNLFTNASRLGSMVGYVVFGALLDRLGHRGIFVICSSLAAITAALFFYRRVLEMRTARALRGAVGD
ncbi:MAG TPA: sugar efflux transporter [Candidatus Synoicihabitans sp.]|nr:sugar efflux transporter [Candidatus Synoicihabitans sp.]